MEDTLKIFNITNYEEHPTNPHYVVFKYSTKEEQTFFEKLLEDDNIAFESNDFDNDNGMVFLVAVKTGDQEQAVRYNYLTKGKFRKRTITNKMWKWLIYIVTGFFIAVALIGYLKNA